MNSVRHRFSIIAKAMLFIRLNVGRAITVGVLSTAVAIACATEPTPPPSDSAAVNADPNTAAATESESTTVPSTPAPTPTAPAAEELTVADASPLPQEELWQRLQQPDEALYVVLLRHALAPGTGDPANFQLDDCATQRNLSDEGREQAQQIGQAFRDRNVAVEQVLSSQWCRCLETAELMNVGEVEPLPALNSFFRDRSTAEAQTTEIKTYLLAQADQPGVVVMVTHQVNITGITGIVPRSGEAVVVQATEDGLTQIGQFMPES